MGHAEGFSRRDFKSVGTATGAAASRASAKEAVAATAMAQDAAAAAPSSLPEPGPSPFPTMNRRSLGWLRFLWERRRRQTTGAASAFRIRGGTATARRLRIPATGDSTCRIRLRLDDDGRPDAGVA